MPYRSLVAKELARFLKAIAHPARIRAIEELRGGERDVNSLQAELHTSHSTVSQHLMVLRAHRLVEERRDGRHVFYSLRRPELADWLVKAMDLLPEATDEVKRLQAAIRKSRTAWQSTKRSEKPANSPSK
ncbi:MAG: metalloregulator ArsR/SmtB family transcription factor [Planctomycetia bacterium]|nr:metalloregulator ArsR/SmtB family transcription factor [Planctomycetia bacterium]